MADVEFTITVDNTELVKKASKAAIIRGLEAVGIQAEGYAKALCPVDTGLLRNSITHAISGRSAALKKYESNATHASTEATKRAGTAGKSVSPKREGEYSGDAPDDDVLAVYVGTNVEYAAYVEMGTSKTKAQPFIQPAIEDHKDEYRKILEAELEKG